MPTTGNALAQHALCCLFVVDDWAIRNGDAIRRADFATSILIPLTTILQSAVRMM